MHARGEEWVDERLVIVNYEYHKMPRKYLQNPPPGGNDPRHMREPSN
jgi:hypothetical protein